MSRVFAYCRVSTSDQTTDNQVLELKSAGFNIDPRRVITESVSGSVSALERPGFSKLMDRLEPGDVLVVTKMDRLGRNVMDVHSVIDKLSQEGVKVHCLALGNADLTGITGRMTMGILSVIAEFERGLLIERTKAGLARARDEGKTFGRPAALTESQQADVQSRLLGGEAVARLAAEFKTSRQTIMRVREKGAKVTAA